MTTGPAISLPAGLPAFSVDVPPPDLSAYVPGNTGITGFTCLDSGVSGPHVVLVSLVHGNEYAGALVLAKLLASGFQPQRGRLTIGFANLAAYARFDPENPIASRYIDEDMNRLWDDFTLFGMRHSQELDRAREIRPIIDSADILLDLHSMFWPSDPLFLCGASESGRALGLELGTPELVISDAGHVSGKRLIEYGRFTESGPQSATSLLLEAGPHWQPETILQCQKTVQTLLRHVGMLNQPARTIVSRYAEVVKTITARTNRFQFVRDFRGGDMIPKAGTVIAYDGDQEIHTPEDNLIMVMPSLKVAYGHTAVRLAKLAQNPVQHST